MSPCRFVEPRFDVVDQSRQPPALPFWSNCSQPHGVLLKTLPENMPDRSVCVLGMGFVGVTLSAVLAQVGFEVSCVEVRADLVRRLNAGQAHFFEPGLTELLTAAVRMGRLRTYEEIPENCKASTYIVTVGTPLDPSGRVDLTSITNISRQIANRIKDGDLVVLRSTVRIGVTRKIVAPILRTSGMKFDLAFCPERTIEGQAMAELRVLPQIIGGETFDAGLRAARLFQHITPTVVRVKDVETAEMIKLVDNSARDMIFAYSNEVAMMCDRIGISAHEVIRSGRLGYSRNGLASPGPVGGPCLSKDPHILCESMEAFGMDPKLTRAARKINEALPIDVGRQVGGLICRGKNSAGPAEVAILGVAFKGRPSTDDIRGTTVRGLIEGLRAAVPDVRLRAYDPIVPRELTVTLGLTPVDDLTAAFMGADAVIIHTDHPAFSSMQLGGLTELMRKPAIVYDFWNLFTEMGAVISEGVSYLPLGSVRLALAEAGSESVSDGGAIGNSD